ncbi:MAG: FKBP-type peptidyl-prolyl cis-trans isomerase [Bacteroidales bacterium]
MTRGWLYFSSVLLLFAFSSCDNSLEDDKRYAEEKVIESYISKKSWTYTKSDGVYHIATVPSYDYEVNEGDTVEFWFVGYTPESSPLVFDTNVKSIAIEASLDTNIRTFEPLRVIAGQTSLLTGLKRGLLLTRLNQQSTIIFTSDLGFKGQIVGPLDEWSSLAYDIQVVYLNGKGIIAEKKILAGLDLSGYTLNSSGLYYKSITANASTTTPTESNVVYGWYQCKLTDGTVVYEVPTANTTIDLSSDDITTALKLGFTLTTVESTTEIVAPSPLCYGKKGYDVVDPYQPLIYTIRLDSIK